MLKATELAKGKLKQGDKLPQSSESTTGNPKLSEIGITKQQSKSACRDCHAETTVSNQSAKKDNAAGVAW